MDLWEKKKYFTLYKNKKNKKKVKQILLLLIILQIKNKNLEYSFKRYNIWCLAPQGPD